MCSTCGAGFVGGKYAFPPEGTNSSVSKVCIPCYQNDYAALCVVCEERVKFGRASLTVYDKTYCEACAVCVECKVDLSAGGEPIAMSEDGALLCVPCDRRQRNAFCEVCDEVLIGDFVMFIGMKFHKECARCCGCDVGLGGGDVPATKGADNRPYCLPCGAKLVAPGDAPASPAAEPASARPALPRGTTMDFTQKHSSFGEPEIPDGLQINVLANGTVVQINPETGTEIRKLLNGTQVQTNADGSVVMTRGDGSKRCERPGGWWSEDDGRGNEEQHWEDGRVIATHASGDVARVDTLKDGVTITIMRDGTSVQLYVDGACITKHVDGTTVQRNADGTTITKKVGGSTVQHNADGSVVTTDASGAVTTTQDEVFIESVGAEEEEEEEAAATGPLPAGWEERDHEGNIYYYHEASDESQWTFPSEADSARLSVSITLPTGWETQEHDGDVYYKHSESGKTQWTLPTADDAPELPEGWEEHEHEGDVYYENALTGEKQWHHPLLQ